MIERLAHNCGFCVTHSLRDAYGIIKSLSHRGREAAGIAAIGDSIDVVKWVGPLHTFDLTDLEKILPGSRYHTYMSHVRYATSGAKGSALQEVHPHTIGGRQEEK